MTEKVSTKQVAQLCGVSVQTIYNWISTDSTFPRGIKRGRKNMWLRADVEAWESARFAIVAVENAHRRASLMPRTR